jgi:hypothetical protein
VFATQAPVNYVCLHCVKPSLRPLSMAISTVAIHIFGDVPSSPLVGIVQVKYPFLTSPILERENRTFETKMLHCLHAGSYQQLEKNHTDSYIDSVLSCCNMVYRDIHKQCRSV